MTAQDEITRLLEPHSAQFRPHERNLAIQMMLLAYRKGYLAGSDDYHNTAKKSLLEVGQYEGRRGRS